MPPLGGDANHFTTAPLLCRGTNGQPSARNDSPAANQ